MLSAPVDSLPLLALDPDQSPLAVQEVGLLVALQLIVVLWPIVRLDTVAEIVTTGLATGGGVELLTAKLALAVPVPPALVQARV